MDLIHPFLELEGQILTEATEHTFGQLTHLVFSPSARTGYIVLHIFLQSEEPFIPILRHLVCFQEVRVSWWAIFVGNHNQSTFHLQMETTIWRILESLSSFWTGSSWTTIPGNCSFCHCLRLQCRQPPARGCHMYCKGKVLASLMSSTLWHTVNSCILNKTRQLFTIKPKKLNRQQKCCWVFDVHTWLHNKF